MPRLVLALFALSLLSVLVAITLLVPTKERPVRLAFSFGSFEDLPGWQAGSGDSASLEALRRSCQVILKRPADQPMHRSGLGGMAGDWVDFCTAATDPALDAIALKTLIEDHLRPVAVSSKGETTGKFTGYFEPLLNGSFDPSERYRVPLYGRPDDLISVDLGDFRKDLRGRRIAGRVTGDHLKPFEDRAIITSNGFKGAKPLLYVDSEVDAFFLHIQGSGRVRLPDGSLQGVGYAAQNGHPYVAVGSVLVREGMIPAEEISMQSINDWLTVNPDKAEALMNRNPSFVFFRLIEAADGPFGSGGVPLVARRALAVDRKHLPLHIPLWLDTTHPDPSDRAGEQLPFQHLMMAQDTGGAIRGEIRGDVFWGFGDDAREIAGRMANGGRYWLLLPKGQTLPDDLSANTE